ncbi:MAG: MBL fold metallo-hydrolase [Methanomassiliicoccus sp.]|nr:MBL fold metallo-hydrolase [Methanomassiliicoccus sp.]
MTFPGCVLGTIEVHVLASGSDGNCTVVAAEDTLILLDAGISGRRIAKLMEAVGLDPRSLDAILLTHEHSDHTHGAGVLSRRFDVPICCNSNTLVCSNLGAVHSTMPIKTMEWFDLGCLSVHPLPILHNAAEPNAFHLRFEDREMLLATDLGKITPEVFAALKDADLAIIEANHDVQMLINGPYPPKLKNEIRSDRGHLSNVDCARALWATHNEERKVFLAHISKNNNTPLLARRTVARTLGCEEDRIDCLLTPDDHRSLSV